jgi:hypothetical protein
LVGCVAGGGVECRRKRPFPLVGLSTARETVAVLRAVGVLDEVVETKEGLVVYPAGLEAESA